MRYRRTTDHVFRRNLMVAAICHLGLVAAVFLFERFGGLVDRDRDDSVTVEIFAPADLLGDLPKGDGVGRGDYAPAPPPVPGSQTASLVPQPPPAPAPAPVPPAARPPAVAQPAPANVPVPKPAPKKKPPVTAKSTAKPETSTAPSGTSAANAGAAPKPGLSTADVRNRFAKALTAAEGGTPYGDGKTPGGGQGRSSVIGSPDGAADGVVGGIGQGTKHWRYYQHVHDKMYEAWYQPGEVQGRRLVAKVELIIARDGTIRDVRLVRSSGNKIMDQSVMTAARSVRKLDPLPPDLGDETASITVEFELEGR